ncbi:MAG: type 4a pilus biogenesis protein PilO [Burkholderiales bacterium]
MAINLKFDKLPWYGQVGAFVVLSGACVGAFWQYYAVSAQESLNRRRAQLATVQAEVQRGLNMVRRLPEFRQELAKKEAELERLRQQLPEERDVADLLRRVQGMATQSNLAIRGFEPQAIANRDLHAEWPIGLKLEGSYHDLGAFLARVSKFPRIINVSDIKIKGRENPIGGSTITAECTATTFVLLEKAGAQAPPKPNGTAQAAATTGTGVTL